MHKSNNSDRSSHRGDNRWPRRRGQRRGQDDRRRTGSGGLRSKSPEERDFDDTNPMGPQRSGYREERLNRRLDEPDIPEDVRSDALDPSIIRELKTLAKDNADMVARHLVMVTDLLDTDPQLALAHARAAKDRAGRVGIVRETNGIAAYHAGEWKEALSELRAARRISGGPGLLPVMADAERGLGNPEKAVEIALSPEASELDVESRAELAIVLAGAYKDLGEPEKALLALQDSFTEDLPKYTQLRVAYAIGDALAGVGSYTEAIEWFEKVAELDEFNVLSDDVKERLEEVSKYA